MTIFADARRAIAADARVGTWNAADGWPLRRFDWPGEGTRRGALLFLGGRGDTFEKYLEAFAHWRAAGWHITSLDWRGQGGSGRLAADPNVGHATDFAPWIADLDEFWRTWQTEQPEPRVVVAHSMGGHLLLQALIEQAIDPAAAVLVAPMLGLRSPVGAWAGERLARAMSRIGDPARRAWNGNERPHTWRSRNALLTGDAERYADELWWYRENPAIQLGPPSWAWLATAFAATRAQRRDPRLGAVRTPILMLVAEADRLVDPRAALAIAARLPAAEVLRFGDESAHEILREADPVRDRALAAIDAFLTAKAAA